MAHSHFHPGFWEDPWEGMPHPYQLFCQQHFGITPLLPSEDFLRHQHAHMHRPRCIVCHHREHPALPYGMQNETDEQNGISEVVNTDTEFRINMDMQYFKPEEIEIKTKDNRVIVHAQHGERPDEHGNIMREFTRQYVLPRDVDPSTVKSSLGKDGMLTLKAPKQSLEAPRERVVPITQETEERESSSSAYAGFQLLRALPI